MADAAPASGGGSDNEIEATLAWMALGHAGVTDGGLLRALLAEHGSSAGLLLREDEGAELLPALLRRRALACLDGAEREFGRIRARGSDALGFSDPRYPRLLREIPDPPPCVMVEGDLGDLDAPAIAIVGSRNASPAGERRAQAWASWLAGRGVTIVSGFAYGIDAAAHRGALRAGGSTVAVLGCGLDVSYPARHGALRAEMRRSGGAFLSEFPLGTRPARWTFPQRNRLISGLASGVLVIQAAARSGTLITAGFAGDQGRDVWAVPGPPEDARARGTNWLIRQGARLVERPQEVLEDLLPSQAAASGAQEDRPHEETQALGTLAEEERGLLASLDHQPVDIDSLAARTGVPVTRASSLLLSLELSGRVRQVAGMRFVKIG